MRIGLGQQARLEQRLMQSPQMIQAMQILQLSRMELEERIEAELLENPFLELAEESAGGADSAADDPTGDRAGPDEGVGAALVEPKGESEEDERASLREEFDRYEPEFEDRGPRGDGEAGDRKLEAMANAPARGRSLAEALLEELALEELDERTGLILEFLAWSLDHRGYLEEPLEALALASPVPETTAEELARALGILRAASHPAMGARNLAECLLLQLDAPGDALARRMVSEHLDDIMHNRLPKIAKVLGVELEAVVEALERIRHLDPSPGQDYGDEFAAPIQPDIVVEEVDGRWEVRHGQGQGPGLRLSPETDQLLQSLDRGGEDRAWARRRLESARWFLDAIEQRRSTILRIAQSVFRHQRGFLEKGHRGQRPLRMQEVADEVGVHISTVSRAVAGKHAQTPHGILPLKSFFSAGTTDASGVQTSQVSVQLKLQELVRAEDPQNPLSDDQLAELLESRHGIRIARRTVTKYRKALSIPPSSQRRAF